MEELFFMSDSLKKWRVNKMKQQRARSLYRRIVKVVAYFSRNKTQREQQYSFQFKDFNVIQIFMIILWNLFLKDFWIPQLEMENQRDCITCHSVMDQGKNILSIFEF